MLGISEKEVGKLGKNCPNLKILQLNNDNLTDAGLDKLTRHLPHLEIISLDVAYNITEEGVAAIARNCKKLRFIRTVWCKKIEEAGMDALIENCPNLRVVGFLRGDPISLKGMYRLAEQMPKLRHVVFSIIDNSQDLKDFYKTFPHLSKIPFVSSTKQLDRLAAL